MSATSQEQSGRSAMSVIWHDLECGGYEQDLDLWRGLAASAAGPILDLGCGTGRVGLELARHGHRLQGLDLDSELVDAFNARAAAAGLRAEAREGDAREFSFEQEFAMVIAPMQLIQVLGSPAERLACLRCAARHLRPGGSVAVAIVDGFPDELADEGAPLLPDAREVDGCLYSSLPLDAGLYSGAIVVRRLRQTVSPGGRLTDELDEIPLRLLSAETIEVEARQAGLVPAGRREVSPTDSHVGSTVVVLEGR